MVKDYKEGAKPLGECCILELRSQRILPGDPHGEKLREVVAGQV